MLKCTYFMTAIDGEFCLRERVLYADASPVAFVTLEWSEIMHYLI